MAQAGFFRKRWVVGAKCTIDFISRNVDETLDAMLACCFEQHECPSHIRFDEGRCSSDGTIHVTFGRAVDDSFDVMLLQHRMNERRILDPTVNEPVALVRLDIAEIRQIARIRERIEIDHTPIAIGQNPANQVAPDKTSSTGNQNGFAHRTRAPFLLKSARKTCPATCGFSRRRRSE